MSIPRLSFLYPLLFQPSPRFAERSLLRSSTKGPATTGYVKRHPHIQNRRHQSTNLERYGSAIELPPPSVNEARDANQRATDVANVREETTTAKKDAGSEPERLSSREEPKKSESKDTPEPASLSAGEDQPRESAPEPELEAPEKPLEKVLQMPAPSSAKKPRPPHLETPPYVHHFDTYTLVRDLGKGGFTQDQSITMMKSVRSLLAANLELARQGLVSKSDIENVCRFYDLEAFLKGASFESFHQNWLLTGLALQETYLFRAACSELRTEIQNSRKSATEKMRSERAHLQHEVDILNQKVTQEGANLKDELKGWFDDRKMAVRMEQRKMESEIQELNYKITVAMSGDARGEVEGLRWFLTRRAALVIATTAGEFEMS